MKRKRQSDERDKVQEQLCYDVINEMKQMDPEVLIQLHDNGMMNTLLVKEIWDSLHDEKDF
ncbi:MAG: hypothetical protein KKH94_04290 [Candidatus Omnitrophica bacterium]|nr:hypothetical protein [Candidatus Omnitrophota bacterium]